MNEMITLRKPIININGRGKGSRAIIIPIEWFNYWERETGESVTEVDIILGKTITIMPVIYHE